MFSNGLLITDDIISKCCKNNANQITPEIYLGNRNASKNKKHLLELGITHIIRIGTDLEDHYKDTFEYLSIDIEDDSFEKIYGFFHVTYAFIEKCISSKGKVFVHCRAGVSRSATLVCSYLMKKKQIDTQTAIKIVIDGRDIIHPNSGFIRQLDEYYMKEISNLIITPKRYRNRSYCSFNFNQDMKSKIKLSVSKPRTRKITDKVINTKNPNTRRLSLENHKVILYRIIDSRYSKINHLTKEEIKIELEKIVMYPEKIISRSFLPGKNIKTEAKNKRHKRLYNLINRESKKIIKDIMERHKSQ